MWAAFGLACGEWSLEHEELVARSAAPQKGPNCASCHFYPPPDANHVFHFGYALPGRANGTVSCRDCHSRSLLGQAVKARDSIFVSVDSAGNVREWSGLTYPDQDFIRSWPLARVDTLTRVRPIEQEGSTAEAGFLRQWLTGPAHLNGAVDVEFDSLISDPLRFGGLTAEFHPGPQTCSAVNCHKGAGDYQWAAPSKALPGWGRNDGK